MKFDLEKALRQVNKLDFRLYSAVKVHNYVEFLFKHDILKEYRESVANIKESGNGALNGTVTVNNTSNGDSSSSVEVFRLFHFSNYNTVQVESLRSDLEINKDLAASRLAEINELNETVRKYVEDLELAKLEVALFLFHVLFR